MATFVLFVDTPTWQFHYDPEYGSYHFEGRCSVRVFMFMGRPFAQPVPSYHFSPTSLYGDDMIFERARPSYERRLRTPPPGYSRRDYPDYVPLSRMPETDPFEEDPIHTHSEDSSPAPFMRVGSEKSVTQPRLARRPEMRPRRGGHARPVGMPTPSEIREFIGHPSTSQRRRS